MADKEIKISRERARMFAYVIYRDIAAYITPRRIPKIYIRGGSAQWQRYDYTSTQKA